MRRSVCIDLDGVLARYEKWEGVEHFGDPLPGAVELTKQIGEFADVVIFTCRCNPEVARPESVMLLKRRVMEWLDKHGFTYHDVYAGTGKPLAAAYIDDRAVSYRPQDGDYPALCLALTRQLCGVGE